MSDARTIGIYDEKAEDYAQLNFSEGPSDTLRAFMDQLPQGARVLDLGCGPGTSARHMAEQGCRVDATDASARMVALAAANPGVTAWQAGFDEIAGDALYDGIWANFSLLHAARRDLPRHLAAIRKALKPGGIFHIAVKEGTGARRDSLGRLYTYYTEAELVALVRAAGLEPGAVRRGAGEGLDGVVAPWISVSANG